jgi:hypothetical protein
VFARDGFQHASERGAVRGIAGDRAHALGTERNQLVDQFARAGRVDPATGHEEQLPDAMMPDEVTRDMRADLAGPSRDENGSTP